MADGAWETSQNLVMRLLEDNAKDLKEIKATMTSEFKEMRKELQTAVEGHRKETETDIEDLRKQIAAQSTEIALLKQHFIAIGGGAGAIVAIIAEVVKATLAHH